MPSIFSWSLAALASASSGSCVITAGNQTTPAVTRCSFVKNTTSSDSCACDAACVGRNDCCLDYGEVCRGACPAHNSNKLLCRDGSSCDPMTDADAYACCRTRGGRWKCPSNLPFMCAGLDGYHRCGDDHCCAPSPSQCGYRTLLQECPAKRGERPSICPSNHGPQQLPEFHFSHLWLGSRYMSCFVAAHMTTLSNGRWQLPANLAAHFCPAHGAPSELQCSSGNTCNVLTHPLKWACCQDEGGRQSCPAEFPVMCRRRRCGTFFSEHCCSVSARKCGRRGPLPRGRCPVAVATSGKNATAVRQCSATNPVMCSDGSCVQTKVECFSRDGLQTDCPSVPACAARDGWEETLVGTTARMACGKDTAGNPQSGLKFRACVSEFANGTEIAKWRDEADSCRPAPLKCASATTESGTVVPYMEVGMHYVANRTNCPWNGPGSYLYKCKLMDGEPKHEITSSCDLRCSREIYCHGNGKAVLTPKPKLDFPCDCVCDPQWMGARCEVLSSTQSPSSTTGIVSSTQSPSSTTGVVSSTQSPSSTTTTTTPSETAQTAYSFRSELGINGTLTADAMAAAQDILRQLYVLPEGLLTLKESNGSRAIYAFSSSGISQSRATAAQSVSKDDVAAALANSVALASGIQFQQSDLEYVDHAVVYDPKEETSSFPVFLVAGGILTIAALLLLLLVCWCCNADKGLYRPRSRLPKNIGKNDNSELYVKDGASSWEVNDFDVENAPARE